MYIFLTRKIGYINHLKEFNMRGKLHFETQAVRGSTGCDKHTGAISYPIFQSATFRHPSLYETTGYDYSRLQNPTREVVEQTIALLEKGTYGLAFSTGMAAITSILKLFKPGDHLIVSEDLYGGVYRALESIYKVYGLTYTFVTISDVSAISDAIEENTVGIWIESPSNPMMHQVDFDKVVSLAKERQLVTIVDNTFLTPYYQRPLEKGIDIVVHSGTKYLSGHNDTLSGFIVTNNQHFEEKLRLIQSTEGGVLSPFDSWLVLRGLKTLHLRMEAHTKNARKVVTFLEKHEKIEQVNYVGIGGMISFTLKVKEWVAPLLKELKLIYFAESLGGCESLMTYPVTQTHESIPEVIRNKVGVTDCLMRLSVGIENVEDIIEDLSQALEACE